MNRLKHVIPSIVLCFISLQSFGQMATVDAGANAQLATIKATNTQNFIKNSSILMEATKTLKTLNKMKSTYDEWTEAVRVVNTVIQSGKEVINISNHVEDMGELYSEAVSLISNEDELSYDQKEIYILVFTKILTRGLSGLDSSLDVTSNGVFEMNDGERLEFIRTIEKDISKNRHLMLYALKKIKTAINEAKSQHTNTSILQNSINAVKQ